MAMPMYAASEHTPVSKCHVAYSTETFLHTYTHTFIHIYDRARTETKKDAGDFFADASIEMARGVFYRDVSSYIHTYIYTYIRSRTYIQNPRTRLTDANVKVTCGILQAYMLLQTITYIYIQKPRKRRTSSG